ncbi:hypothetical protein AMECASPLE_029750 [Ameca splendens]|uniref:Uncharacterized protein n=1 Tax=Ameca splendens TaxID=208324 RepID=A0ABV0ZRM6_9TELE
MVSGKTGDFLLTLFGFHGCGSAAGEGQFEENVFKCLPNSHLNLEQTGTSGQNPEPTRTSQRFARSCVSRPVLMLQNGSNCFRIKPFINNVTFLLSKQTLCCKADGPDWLPVQQCVC